ncbi:uncharacterized protein LOC135711574 [Ochlerotatus camptorhynchus]|uniref:uncharacterized protein LOC135711574 n=1 Tax=Ochlerotatus camptorhynchus TaxID=644619 RepID=UPI0031D11AF9
MKSLLISTVTVLLGSTLFSGFATAAAIVVLVANGSDITINLSAEYSHNRLLNVVSDSGNNNPSVFDWIGGNGANKAPRLSIGGGNQGSHGATRGAAAAVIDALWKRESSTVSGNDLDEYDDSGETKVPSSTEGVRATRAPSTSSLSLSSGTTRTTLNTWYGKYVTAAMENSG